MNDYLKGTKVVHLRTQREETIVGLCKMKINESWTEGVAYEGIDVNTGLMTLFVKPKDVFDKEFILSKLYNPTQDFADALRYGLELKK